MDEKRETLSRIFVSNFPADPEGFRTGAWRRSPGHDDRIVPLYPTLVHALANAARLSRDVGVTLVHAGGKQEAHRAYADIETEVRRVGAQLRAMGVAQGDRVVLVLPTSFELIIFFFALEWLGAIPVPTYPPERFGRLDAALAKFEHILRNSGAQAFVVSGPNANLLGAIPDRMPDVRMLVAEHVLAEASSIQGATLAISEPEIKVGQVASEVDDPRWSSKTPAFIQYTSGSTGEPKGAVIEHRHALSNIHAIGQASQISRSDVVVSWLPLHHDMGLIGAMLFAFYWCVPLVLLSPTTFLANPLSWLSAIHRHKGTLSPAPNFAFAHCVARIKPEEVAALDLSSWRIAFNGAEPVSYAGIEQFARTFAPAKFKPEAMLPVYGLAEATLAVSFWRPGVPPRAESVDREALASGQVVPRTGPGSTLIVSVGTAIPGHKVLVVDEAGRALPDGEVGHIVVRGPSVMRGYWHNEKETARRLRDGWLWTGDLGYTRDEELFVTGRASDLIIVRGKNYYAEDLETIAERVPGVRAGSSVAFGVYDEKKARDQVVVVCEVKKGADAEKLAKLEDAVRDAVSAESGLSPDDVLLVPPGTIPRTSSGKRQRQRLKARYRRGDVRTMLSLIPPPQE